jgi:hypothetical protein
MVNQKIVPQPDGSALIELLRDAIRRRQYSYRTEQAYVDWVRRFISFIGHRDPADLGAPEVSAFLSHLARDRSASVATQKQVQGALGFFYSVVLGKKLPGMQRGRRPVGARQPRAEYRVGA